MDNLFCQIRFRDRHQCHQVFGGKSVWKYLHTFSFVPLRSFVFCLSTERVLAQSSPAIFTRSHSCHLASAFALERLHLTNCHWMLADQEPQLSGKWFQPVCLPTKKSWNRNTDAKTTLVSETVQISTCFTSSFFTQWSKTGCEIEDSIVQIQYPAKAISSGNQHISQLLRAKTGILCCFHDSGLRNAFYSRLSSDRFRIRKTFRW